MVSVLNSNINYLLKNSIYFEVGEVVKVFYIVRKRRKKRIYSYIGLCLSKTRSSFLLYNKLRKEKLLINFTFFSPALLKIFVIKMYKPFTYRISRMYFKNNLFVKDDDNFYNIIQSSIESYTFDYNSFYTYKRMVRSKIKRFLYKYKFRKIVNHREVVNSIRNTKDYKYKKSQKDVVLKSSLLFKTSLNTTYGSTEYSSKNYSIINKCMNFFPPRKLVFSKYYNFFLLKIRFILNN